MHGICDPSAQPNFAALLRDGERLALAPLQNASALPFGGPAPNPVIDPIAERVFEAWFFDRAIGTDGTGFGHTSAVGGKELTGVQLAALSGQHPRKVGVVLELHFVVHRSSPCSGDETSAEALRFPKVRSLTKFLEFRTVLARFLP